MERSLKRGHEFSEGMKIPADYRDFSYSAHNGVDAAQRLVFSGLYHALTSQEGAILDAENATIDTQPGDTH